MPKNAYPTDLPKERAFVVGTSIKGQDELLPVEGSMRELALLADTAGLEIVGEATQKLGRPDPKTYIGSGKVAEIQAAAHEVSADLLIFDEELSPRHQRELEKIFGDDIRIIDRTALILDVFAQHAHTREGSLQVELAQYEYRLPRLTRAWTHLARQAGGGAGRTGGAGGVGLRGPGETQLEVDRREIGRKISHLKKELEKIRAHRNRYRERRRRSEIPLAALVGYTNAGKSTLLNALSGSDVLVADQLFATLDPTTRRVNLPSNKPLLITDTVGFIQKLPTTLVAAFRATLEEISEADFLIHVVDITHTNARAQAEAVRATLEMIGVSGIPTVTALNKIDLLDGSPLIDEIDEYEMAVPISAQNGDGLQTLLTTIEHELYELLEPVKVRLPYKEGRLISQIHTEGIIDSEDHAESYVEIVGKVPQRLAMILKPYMDDHHS